MGGDHGLGISQAGMQSAEVIKGPMSLIYTGDATGGLLYLKDGSFAPQIPMLLRRMLNSKQQAWVPKIQSFTSFQEISFE